MLVCNKSNGKGHFGYCNSWKRRTFVQQIQHMVLLWRYVNLDVACEYVTQFSCTPSQTQLWWSWLMLLQTFHYCLTIIEQLIPIEMHWFMLFVLHLSRLFFTVALYFQYFFALLFMWHNPISVYSNSLILQVMLVCGKYNLVYEFFNKVEKSSIPGALNYKGILPTTLTWLC